MSRHDETIAALATAPGEAAVALVRVSGPTAAQIAETVFRRAGRPLEPRRAVRVRVHAPDGEVLDDGLATRFAAPASYTGEEVVEFSGHGGPQVARRVLEAFLAAGARPAEPGEFTQRAFLHGKMDLTQAEAVMDLIRAQSDLALRAARQQLAGGLRERIEQLREALLDVVAHVEAYIDFPDEDISPETGVALRTRAEAVREGVAALLDTARPGRLLREGVRTVLFGAPNAGKSSLLNALAGFDRAIVSATPGTTRDTIEEFIAVRGLPLRLIDTAGLRASDDAVEQAGIARTQRALAEADLALEVIDATLPPAADAVASTEGAARLRVLNKVDLGEHPAWRGQPGLRVSCRTGAGVRELAEAIHTAVTSGEAAWAGRELIAVNARHRACLERCAEALEHALATLAAGESPEFVALDLRIALGALGEVVGGTDVEDILGRIFATFCLGK
ncbi:MAG: tRNA uridine-5-carboxymethylaminomethyl(34) synthesis GTPase MnmE [Verrucomicrobia bacterium]|nr:tRNA uridine-5-carboxymethylaminomethyl(34) synthesis GTPase MnmE [Verrucomicrobiota bacterium]